MAKIRGFKPDLWTDENFVELSAFARLLWMGMWNHACDNGHIQDKSKQIKMRILPTDDVNAAELLREIEAQGLIERDAGWITIPNLSHHQKPHKRWYVTCEKAGCVLPEGASYGYPKRESTVDPPLTTRSATVNNGGSTADVDGEGDGEVMVMVKETPSRKRSDTHPRFDEFWDTYGKKVDRRTAERRWTAALKKPGVTADLLIAAAAAYVLAERENQGGRYILDPSRWLLNERWRDERPARVAPRTRVQEHLALVAQLGENAPSPFPEIGSKP